MDVDEQKSNRCKLTPGICLLIGVIFLSVSLLLFCFCFDPAGHFNAGRLPILASPAEVRDGRTEENQKLNSPVRSPFINVLLLGIDSRAGEPSRTDVIMLGQIRPTTKKMSLVSIPRDTRVRLGGLGYTKINHAHIIGELRGGNRTGTESALRAVSDLCGIDIHYYVKIDFAGFKQFIDWMGGLEVELPRPLRLTYDNLTLPAKRQHLNGHKALMLIRERESLPDGDFGRQRNQYIVLKALALKMLEPQHLCNIRQIFGRLQKNVVDTNFSAGDLVSLALLFEEMNEQDISYFQIPGQGGYDYDPLVKSRIYYWNPDVKKLAGIIENQ